MRRTILVVLMLLLGSMPGAVHAQSSAPSGPPTMSIAPGVTAEVLAFMQGQGDPVVVRLRFDPGSSWDAPADPTIALATVESGTLVVTLDKDVTAYLPGGAAGQPTTAGTATTMPQGTYFLAPTDVAGHFANESGQDASLVIAVLQVSSAAP